MAKGQLGQMLVLATGVGASDSRNPSSSYNASMAAAVVNQMFQLRYGRQDESQADQWGLKLMEEAGYDPKAMLEVMEILKHASGGGHGPDIFQTHPNPDKRIEDIKAYLKAHPPGPGLTEGSNLKQMIHQ
jgi:predicted Zn-dependent protease